MKAWEMHRRTLSYRDTEPAMPGEGETAISVSYAGICGSDLPKLRRPECFSLPERWIPGHEIVGNDRAGNAVAIDPLIPCERCRECRSGDSHLCASLWRLGWDLPGGFAERVIVPGSNVHPLPGELASQNAVLADPAAVAIHGLRCAPMPTPGKMAIIGAGPVGLLTSLYAHHMHWHVTVIHRDTSAPSAEMINGFPADFRSASNAVTRHFDLVVDAASGSDSTPLELALELVRDGGTIIVQNAYAPGVYLPTSLRALFGRSIRLIGSFSHCRSGAGDFVLALGLLSQYPEAAQRLVAPTGSLNELTRVLNSVPYTTGRPVLTAGD